MLNVNATLLSVLFGITLMNALVMIHGWRIHFGERSIALWTVGFVGAAAAAGVTFLRPYLPVPVSILLTSVFALTSAFSMTLGLACFVGRPEPWRLVLVASAVAMIGIAWCTLVSDSQQGRLLFYSAAAMLAHCRTALYLLSRSTRPAGRSWFLLMVIVPMAMLSVAARAVLTMPHVREWLAIDETRLGLFWSYDLILVQVLAPTGLLMMTGERLMRNLEQQAHHDALTGILNRRAFIERAEIEAARAGRHRRPVGLLLLDIDHFKRVNDTYGHYAGDEMLRGFVAAIAQTLRKEDVFCRFGGEEFCLLLPEIDLDGAGRCAERIRRLVAGLQVPYEGGPLSVTVSIGVALLEGGPAALSRAIDAADRALYRAKTNGRNRIELDAAGVPALTPAPASP